MKIGSAYIMDDQELYDISIIKLNKNNNNNINIDTDVDTNVDTNIDVNIDTDIDNDEDKYTCKVCLTQFKKKYNLTRHQKSNCKNSKNSINMNITNNNIDKSINQTVNKNVNQNIYNFNINLIKSFDEEWDTTKMDKYLKLALVLSTNKYSNTIKSLLENDSNMNVLFNDKNNYGMVYNKDDKKFNNMDIKDIVKVSMEKLHKHLLEFHKEINIDLKGSNLDIDKDILDIIASKIDSKYENYVKDEILSNNVNKLFSSIYNEKYTETKNKCKELLEDDGDGY